MSLAVPTWAMRPFSITMMRSPSTMRLGLVVGDVDGGDAEAAQQRVDLDAQALAQRGVERGQRLVEQQQPRPHGERARQRDALALAARELIDAALGEFADAHHVQDFARRARRARPRATLRILRP